MSLRAGRSPGRRKRASSCPAKGVGPSLLGRVADEMRGRERERESFEWRELLKSPRPLKFSPVVNYPKKEITVEFDHPRRHPLSVFIPHPLSARRAKLPSSPSFQAPRRPGCPRSRGSSVSLSQGEKPPAAGRGAAFSDKKLAGVANVSTLNHIFIATLIQPF